VNLLLDTHAFLWFANDDPQLGADARRVIEEPGADVAISVASVWEISIKAALKKLKLPEPAEPFVPHQLAVNSIRAHPIELAHALRVALLPQHHNDPFDRLIIAQALVENLTVVSRDRAFDSHGVRRVW
jgi:PIN domain nuclease of toxin-antitoxin system